jgi:hypothetical protein
MLALTCQEEDISDKPRKRAEAEFVIASVARQSRGFVFEASHLIF